MSSHVRWLAVCGLLALGTVAGCTCSDQVGQVPDGNKDAGKPPVTQLTCVSDSDCCPGQTCTNDGKCLDKFDGCSVATDCGEAADRACLQWDDPALGPSMRCTFNPCGANESCPEGQACFAGFCVINAPCGGSCPAGHACVPQAAGGGRCHPYGDKCDLQPKPGFLVVFTDPANVYSTCDLSKVACKYEELPPLPAVDLARHPAAAIAGGKILVSLYDGHYGDLALSEFDLTGARLQTTWVDGVPTSGVLMGGPNGPRGGIEDPGDDVGKFSSIVAKPDGTLFISYYDSTHGDLRFAERSASGAWTTHTVDGAAADLGLYTSLVLDPGGKPAIAYFQRRAADTSTVACPAEPTANKALITGVKLARAKVTNPKSAADWDVELASCAARPPPPCWGCTGSQVCVKDPATVNGTKCMSPASGCSSCASGQACVSGNVCRDKGSAVELADLPWGRGLFPSLAFKGTTPVIAHYDRTKGNLVVSHKPSSAWEDKVIDGEDAKGDTGNVGMFPSLVIDPGGSYVVAYHDFTRRGLRIWSGTTLAPIANQSSPAASSFVDTGISEPAKDGPAWVGANASLAITSAGTFVAYQNSTASDLRVSRKTTTGWKVDKAWTQGGLGFFARLVPTTDGFVVVHTRLHAKIVDGKAMPDNQLKLEFYKPTP